MQVNGAISSTIQTVDASGRMGSYVCLALDSKGNPGISYYDFTNYHLKYAHWTGVNWDVQTVDTDFFTGLHTAIAFDSMDNPHISYDGQSNLMYAHWTGTAWDIQTVDVAGGFTSIAIDVNDYPHISYYAVQNGNDLKYASWTGSSWSIQTIDSDAYVGEFTSLKLDRAGNPHISYWDFGKNFTNEDLKVAWCDDLGWHIQTVDSVGDVGKYSSLDLDNNGKTHISYYDIGNGDLKYAVSNGSSWNIQVVDSTGDVGTDSSLALDSQGNPHISYTDNTNHILKYASWSGFAWNIISLRSAGYVGEYTSLPNDQTSLKIGKDDKAHIAYCDWGNYWLKYISAPDEPGFAVKYVQPTASLNINPNPVQVGQTISFNMSLVPRPPLTNDHFSNVTLSITDPAGDTSNLGPFLTDPTGMTYTSYVATQVGNYSIQIKYSGQFFSSNNATYLPTQSQVLTLKVQQEPVLPSPSPSPSPIPTPITTPTLPRPTPKSSAAPTPTTVPATSANGTIVNLAISGNITGSQMSNIRIATNKSAESTIVSATVQGESGTIGFSNITIAKSNVPYGTTPTITIDNHHAVNQGWTQDNANYYVWYTTTFSTHQISVVFIATSVSPTPTPSNQLGIQPIQLIYGLILGLALTAVVIAIVSAIMMVKKK
ncbi:MAG: hypothetical protein ACXV2C_05720 [Candidatus Bathyarchaeia archaeon]